MDAVEAVEDARDEGFLPSGEDVDVEEDGGFVHVRVEECRIRSGGVVRVRERECVRNGTIMMAEEGMLQGVLNVRPDSPYDSQTRPLLSKFRLRSP